jgi:hypothetical protein
MRKCLTLSVVGLSLCLCLLLPRFSWSQEFYALGGTIRNAHNDDDQSYLWGISYLEGLGEHFAFSFSWLNEGHLDNHHRDGLTGQLWVRTRIANKAVSLLAGAGPYFYFDTTTPRSQPDCTNAHSWAAAFSVAATLHSFEPFLLHLRLNWIESGHSADTLSAALGLGYHLDTTGTMEQAGTTPFTADNELALLLGATVDNSHNNSNRFAQALEYRRRLAKHAELTVGWLNEGNSSFFGRNGPFAQLWLARGFYSDRFSLGLGLGPYFAFHEHTSGDYERNVATLAWLLTMTAGYRLDDRWGVRLSWHRVISHYDRDADVVVAGLGYLF